MAALPALAAAAAPLPEPRGSVPESTRAPPPPHETVLRPTMTKIGISEREACLAHMASTLGSSPAVYSDAPAACAGLLASYASVCAGEADADAFRKEFEAHAFDDTDPGRVLTMEHFGLSLNDAWLKYDGKTRFASRPKRAEIVIAMMRALWDLHAGGIKQGDAHGGNICVREMPDGTLQARVIDFGRSSFVGRTASFSGAVGFANQEDLVDERERFFENAVALLSVLNLVGPLRFLITRPPFLQSGGSALRTAGGKRAGSEEQEERAHKVSRVEK